MRFFGLLLIFLAFAVPIPWFLDLSLKYSFVAVFSQYLGALALISMGVGQVLAARLPGSEMIFGGLDRIYVLHKWLAVFALVCLGLHDVIDAEIEGLGRETSLMDIAEEVGEFAYYGLLLLVFVTITTLIPYHYWRWSHRFIGLFFCLGIFHFAFVQKPFDTLSPIGIYVLSFGAAGVLSYIYMIFLYVRFAVSARYKIAGITHYNKASEIILMPEGKGIRHSAGQFAFFGFDLPDLNEIHPFTISCRPTKANELRICVKALGGYTDDLLDAVKVGGLVRVYGAFGRFKMPVAKAQQIWIASGIGITPFMAWARNLSTQNRGPIHLYYSVQTELNAPYIDELKSISQSNPNFELTLTTTQSKGRLSADEIVRDHKDQIRLASVCFCGPTSMRDQMRAELSAHGMALSRFQYEVFEIRSGIGFIKAANWIIGRFR